MLANNTEIALRLVKKLARRLDSADEMIQMLLNPDPQARVLLALKRHAEAFGEESAEGVRLHGSAADLAREVDIDVAQVRDVLSRLRRLRIATEDETGALVVMDLPRLMEFMEFLEMPGKFEG
jgi:CRP-like cAMP-binding protein